MTYEEFCEKANVKHKNKYIYPYRGVINSFDKIEIECPEHGVFVQVAYAHLRGQGCPKCYRKRNGYTTEDFINESKNKFGNKFGYEKTVYVNKRTKVILTSKELITEDNPNGEFEILPIRHLESHTGGYKNRKKRGKYLKLTDENTIKSKTEIFKQKAFELYGNRFIYDKSIYTGCQQKLIVTCKLHGDFEITPNNFLRGHSCPKCAGNLKMKFAEFKEMANMVHNSKYEYVESEFKGGDSYMVAICPEHGIFKQAVQHHLSGCGCPECAGNKPLTTETFIQKSIYKHGLTYDYSKTVYNGYRSRLKIICPKHGEFWQIAASHLSGEGCPICRQSKLEEELSALFNRLNFKFIREYKVKGIRNIMELPFDFYLENFNVLVECQGIQHFTSVEHFKNTDFNERLRMDKIKLEGAVSNGIRLLYFTNIDKLEEYIENDTRLKEIYSCGRLFTNTDEFVKEIMNSND